MRAVLLHYFLRHAMTERLKLHALYPQLLEKLSFFTVTQSVVLDSGRDLHDHLSCEFVVDLSPHSQYSCISPVVEVPRRIVIVRIVLRVSYPTTKTAMSNPD